MAKFQVLSGKHYEKGEAEPYRQGEVVESDLDLDILFANKFMRIGAPVPEQQARRRPGKAPKGGAGSQANVDQERVPQTMRARTVQNDDVYDNIQDHQEVLAGKRPGTSSKVIVPGPLSSRDVGNPASGEEVGRQSGGAEESAELGDDVSEQFDGAVDAGLIVYKEAPNKYHVVKEDAPAEPISKKAGLKKVEVRKFIQKQAAKAEEEAPPEE